MDVVATFLAVLGIVLTAIGIFISVSIYRKQDQQMKQHKDLGEQTKSIAETLRTDHFVLERASKFFSTPHDKPKKFKIVYPVEYVSSPLPLIHQGDFFAIHVVTLAIKPEQLEFKEVAKEVAKEVSDVEREVDPSLPEGNVIFVCSPQTNKALSSVLPFASIDFSGKYEKAVHRTPKDVKRWLRDIDLPCWFADNYNPSTLVEKVPAKQLQIFDLDDPGNNLPDMLPSPAESRYIEASRVCVGVTRV